MDSRARTSAAGDMGPSVQVGSPPAVLATRATARTPLPALLGWLGFVLLLVYAVMVGGGYGGTTSVVLRIVSLSIIIVVLAGWAIAAWRIPAWRPSTAIWPALVFPVASLALSTLLSRFPRLGIEYVAWSVLLVALYLLLVRILALDFTRARIGGLAAILGGIIGLLYLAVVVGEWLTWWELLGRFEVPPLRPSLVGLPFGGPNLVATVVVLLTVVAFAGLGPATTGRRVTLALLMAITAAVVIVSGSRSSWLAVAGAFTAVGALWLLLNHRLLSARLGDPRAWLVLGAGLAVLVVAALSLGPTMLDRLLNAGDGGRPSYWAAALRMFGDAPVLGLGPGSWAARRIAYLEPGELEYSVPHAHDIYLQTGAELGLVGLAAGVIAFATMAWLIGGALGSPNRSRVAWAWGALFATVYMAVVNVVDFYANLPGVLALWVVPIATLDATAPRGFELPALVRPATGERLGRLATAALALGCVVSVIVLGWAEWSALRSARATAQAESADWEAAAAFATEAASLDPAHTEHQLMRALTAMHIGDWEAARAAYHESLAVDDLPQGWLGLALATLEAGGPEDEVTGYLEAAMRMGRHHPAVSYAVGEVYDRMGLTARSDAAYVEALLGLPALASDPHWRTDPVLAGRFDALLEAAIARSGPSGWQLALMAGDAERAREIALGGPGAAAPGSLVSDTIHAWEGDAEALARMQAMADADPTDNGLLTTAGLLTERAGDAEGAGRFRRLALVVTEGVPALGLAVHTAPSCDGHVRVPAASDLHGQWAYRRPTPDDLVPAGLRCLVFDDSLADS